MWINHDIPLTLAEQWLHSQVSAAQTWKGLSTNLRFAYFCEFYWILTTEFVKKKLLIFFVNFVKNFFLCFIHEPQKTHEKCWTVFVVFVPKFWVVYLIYLNI